MDLESEIKHIYLFIYLQNYATGTYLIVHTPEYLHLKFRICCIIDNMVYLDWALCPLPAERAISCKTIRLGRWGTYDTIAVSAQIELELWREKKNERVDRYET